MSFSGQVKEELSRHCSTARHCQIAELAAILMMNGHIRRDSDGKIFLAFQSENEVVVRKCFTLLKKTFNIETEIRVRQHTGLNKGNVYLICLDDSDEAKKVLQGIKAVGLDEEGSNQPVEIDSIVFQKNCCKRAFIRGCFLASAQSATRRNFIILKLSVPPRRKRCRFSR